MTTQQPSTIRKWITAIRPFAYTASLIPVLLGLILAVFEGYDINWFNFFVTLSGVLFFHTATNLLNDRYDYRRGLDVAVTPVSGALVRGWLTDRQLLRAALLCVVSGCMCGLFLVAVAGLPVLWMGIAGFVIALGYTRNGVCLKYTGLGDFAVFIGLGILPVIGTYWVQTRQFSWLPVLWAPVVSLFTVGILHANNWRDIDGDKAHSCRTVAGLLGINGSAWYYRILMFTPFVLIVFYFALHYVKPDIFAAPATSLLTFLSLPLVIRLTKVTPQADNNIFVILDGKTAQAQLVFGLLLIIGFYIACFF